MNRYIKNNIFFISACVLFFTNIIFLVSSRYLSVDSWWVDLLVNSNTPPIGYTYSFFLIFSISCGAIIYIFYKLICFFIRWLINWKPLPRIFDDISNILFSLLCVANIIITYGVFNKLKQSYLQTHNYEFVKLAASQYYTVLLVMISIIIIVFISILVCIYKINRVTDNSFYNSNNVSKYKESNVTYIVCAILFCVIVVILCLKKYSSGEFSKENGVDGIYYGSSDDELLKIKKMINDINSTLPRIINDGVRLDNILYSRYSITNKYTFINYNSKIIKKSKKMLDDYKIDVILNACNEKEMNNLMNKYDMTYWYIYYGNDQKEAFGFYVDKNICKKYGK